MAYTYRFVDSNGEIIYVGYTGQSNVGKRMNQHFTKGHLPDKCYKSVAKIEFIEWSTDCDAQVMEVYYINKYKPMYNTLNKRKDKLTLQLEDKKWKVYKVLKVSRNKKFRGITILWRLIVLSYLLYLVYKFYMS